MHEAATNPSMEHKERVLFSGYFRSKRRPKLPSVHRYVVPIKQASFINGTWKVASFPQKQKVEKEKKSKQTDLPRNSESPRKGVVFSPTQCVSEGKPRGLIDPPDRGRRPRFVSRGGGSVPGRAAAAAARCRVSASVCLIGGLVR